MRTEDEILKQLHEIDLELMCVRIAGIITLIDAVSQKHKNLEPIEIDSGHYYFNGNIELERFTEGKWTPTLYGSIPKYYKFLFSHDPTEGDWRDSERDNLDRLRELLEILKGKIKFSMLIFKDRVEVPYPERNSEIAKVLRKNGVTCIIK